MPTKFIRAIRVGVCYTFIGLAYPIFLLGIIIGGVGIKGYFSEVASWHKDYWNNVG